MAIMERINIQSMQLEENGETKWKKGLGPDYLKLPQIFFSNGDPWLVANAYALDKIQGAVGANEKTVNTCMNHLRAYASWLEDNNVDWRAFPKALKERCIFRFRGFLILQRQQGILAPSTVSARINVIVKFYKWAKRNNWFNPKYTWEERNRKISFYSTEGLSRTFNIPTTELSIPNRGNAHDGVEDGLYPLKIDNRDILLRFLNKMEKEELYLMAVIGCFTGMRSETIRTLRVSSIENVLEDPITNKIKHVSVGPGTNVNTKFDVSGMIKFPTVLLERLEQYAYSVRRLRRQSKAEKTNRDLLFITTRGNMYSDSSFTKLISDLRVELRCAGLTQFNDFKFHQTRATFGTNLMRLAMETLPNQTDALIFVRDAMLHKYESTTWKYIKYIENEPLKEKYAEEFFNFFVGNIDDQEISMRELVNSNEV